ncbi:MAG: CheY-like chemotaxis protein, partial [Kiritimatiellia bacterium]
MKKIMIIDDEKSFTRLCKMTLEAVDAYQTIIVNDPLDAIFMISKVKPDLIFLDVIMPGINGPDLAAQIRANASMRDIPIIFLSASVVKTGGGKP